MKKHFILKVIAVAAIALAGVSYESTAQPLDSLFVEGGGSGTGGGRNLPINDLQVSVLDFFGTKLLIVTVQSNLGTVDFCITNTSTGEYLDGEFNALPGSYPIPISGTPGYYTISFILPDGRSCYGTFELN